MELSKHHRFINRLGHRLGRLVVTKFLGTDSKGQSQWECKCDCGRYTTIYGGNIRRTKSCGCLSIEGLVSRSRSHGKKGTKAYCAWNAMKNRCYNPNVQSYPRYGGRGIKVCGRWKDSFTNFLADMGEPPSPKHSLDRINGNGDYEPANCRWATALTQSRNRSISAIYTIGGETKNLSAWCAHFRTNSNIVTARLLRGWSITEALSKPARTPISNTPAAKEIIRLRTAGKTYTEIERQVGVGRSTAHRIASQRE